MVELEFKSMSWSYLLLHLQCPIPRKISINISYASMQSWIIFWSFQRKGLDVISFIAINPETSEAKHLSREDKIIGKKNGLLISWTRKQDISYPQNKLCWMLHVLLILIIPKWWKLSLIPFHIHQENTEALR